MAGVDSLYSNGFPQKKKSVLYSWIGSYILILLIPMLISGVVYMQSTTIIKNEINRANVALLNEVKQAMDNQLQDIRNLAFQIAWNDKVEGLIGVKNSLTPYNIFTIRQMINDFGVYKVANGFIDDFYVYFRNTDIVVSPSGLYNSAKLYQNASKYEQMSYEEWHQFVQGYHQNKYLPLVIKDVNGERRKYIGFIQSIPIHNRHQADANLVIQLEEKRLKEAVDSLNWVSQGIVFIIDKENNILASTDSSFSSTELKYEMLTGQSGIIYRQLDEERVAISYTTSNVSDWKYVSIIPEYIFLDKVEYIRKLILISVLLCLLVGGIMAYMLSRKNYYPLNDLIQSFIHKVGIPIWKDNSNEYIFLKEAISKILEDQEEINERLKQQNDILRTNFILKMLKGRIGKNYSIEDSLAAFNIHFYSDIFAVVLLYIEDFEGLFYDSDNEDQEQRLNLVQFIINNVIQELMGQTGNAYMAEMDESIACLVNFHEGQEINFKEKIIDIIKQAQKFVQKEFQIYFTASISNIYYTIAGISNAYREALDAMEYKMVVGESSIIHYDDIKGSVSGSDFYYYSIEMEQQFINTIKAGDFDNAKNILDMIFEKSFSERTISINAAKCIVFNLINTIMKAVYEISSTFMDSSFVDTLNPVERLLQCDTVMDLKKHIMDILLNVCNYINENEKNNSKELSQKIIGYVMENYHNIDLNVSMIAEVFQMNPDYISRVFKNQTGEALSYYINKVRIDKSKELLKSDSLNICDIANKVGFYNSNTFIRAFKRLTGITPGKYRETNAIAE